MWTKASSTTNTDHTKGCDGATAYIGDKAAPKLACEMTMPAAECDKIADIASWCEGKGPAWRAQRDAPRFALIGERRRQWTRRPNAAWGPRASRCTTRSTFTHAYLPAKQQGDAGDAARYGKESAKMDIHGYAAALPKGSNIASTLKQKWCLARGHSSTAISNRCSRPFQRARRFRLWPLLLLSLPHAPPAPASGRRRVRDKPYPRRAVVASA